eukprot:9845200-Alexandrium_andersonii.AAC.1
MPGRAVQAGWRAKVTPPDNLGTRQSWPILGAGHSSDGSRPEAAGSLSTGAWTVSLYNVHNEVFAGQDSE